MPSKKKDTKQSSMFLGLDDMLNQKKSYSNKIYPVHEPDVQCISKGKEQKK